MSLQFEEGSYTVYWRTESIRLLAKEFALCIFCIKTKTRPSRAVNCWIGYGPWNIRWNAR